MDHAGAIEHILNRLEEELPPHLSYHGHHHTLDVLEATERIARSESVTEKELDLVLVAAAYHDCGFLLGPAEHEKSGCKIAVDTLPEYGFDSGSINEVCAMIMATKVPQTPLDKLAEILCDADLDYLGRNDFTPVATSLFNELHELGIVNDIESWNRIQLKFLVQHRYHTAYGNTFRQPQKQLHLDNIRAIVEGYDE